MAITRYAGDRFYGLDEEKASLLTKVLDGAYYIALDTEKQFVKKDGAWLEIGGSINGSGISGYLPAWTDQDTLGNSTIYQSGANIGINTIYPEHALHISGDVQISGYLYDINNSTGQSGWVLTSESGGPVWRMIEDVLSGVGGFGESGYVARWQDQDTLTTGALYDDGTNVGIGTNAPQHAFHVNGDAQISGYLYDIYNSTGQSGWVLTSESGGPVWRESSAGTIDGSGISGYLSVWEDQDTLGNSPVYQYGSNIGVDTTTIGAKLQVGGNNAVDTAIMIDAAAGSNGNRRWKFNAKAGSNHLEIGSNTNTQIFVLEGANGSVGVGKIPDTNIKLDVEGFIQANKAVNFKNAVRTWQIQGDNAPDYLKFLDTTAGTLPMVIEGGASDYSVHIASGAKVGINTNTPQHAFHVNGDAMISGYLYDSLNTTGQDGWVLTSKSGGSQWQMIEDVLSGVGGSGTANYVPLWQDEDTIGDSVIAQSGVNVGIGTDTPDVKLKIVSSGGSTATPIAGTSLLAVNNAQASNNSRIGIIGGTTGFSILDMGDSADQNIGGIAYDNNANKLYLRANDNYFLTILSDGKVGIGTQIPSNLLHLSSSAPAIRFEDTDNADNAFSIIEDNNGNLKLRADASNASANTELGLEVDGSRVMTLVGGSVGIGINPPAHDFHISGDAQISGYLYDYTNSTGLDGYVLTSRSGGPVWEEAGGGTISGSGVSGYVARWDGETNLTSGVIYDNGTSVGIGTTTLAEALTVNGRVEAEEFIGDLRGAVVFKANAGENISKGQAVYISGISGNKTVVSLADADDASKMPAFGVAAETVSANSDITIVTFGRINNLDTSAYTEGDELFVSTTAGVLTDTPPAGESALLQKLTKVTRSDSSAGSMTVMGAGRTNAVPNLNEGRIFVGDSGNQAIADGTVYVDIANSKVGINTTSPQHNLHVSGNAIISGYLYDSTNSTGTAGYVLTSEAGGPQWQMIEDVLSGVGGSGTANYVPLWQDEDTLTDSVIAQSGSYIGIGTASPAYKLDINGGAVFLDSDWPLYLGSTNAFIEGNSSGTIVRINGSAGLRVTDGGDTRFLIDTNGNVGVGTTGPSALLHINRDDVTRTDVILENNDSAANAEIAAIQYKALDDGSASQLYAQIVGLIDDPTAGTEKGRIAFETADAGGVSARMTIDGSRVGIGTVNPDSKLHVVNNDFVLFENTIASANSLLKLKTASRTWQMSVREADLSGSLTFRNETAGTDDLIINTAGSIGVGEPNPAHKLHVNGDAIISGYLYDYNNTTGEAGYVLTSEAGGPQWKQIEDVLSGVGGSGVADYVARWQDEDTLTTGILYDNGSNVGVGTNSPSSIFTVSQSSLPVISTIEAGSNLDTFTNTDAGILRFRGPYSNSYTPIGDIKVRTNTSAFRTDIVLMPRSTGGSLVEGLVVHGTISDGAFVGIGTGTPSSKLHVLNPDTDATPTALLQNGSTGDASLHFNVSGRSYTIGIDNSDDDKFKIARNNGLGTTDRLTINGDGNIGIGTTNPTSLLHLRNPNADSDVGIKIGNDVRDWNLKVMGSVSDSFQIFTHDDSNVFTILSDGNVGINTTSPTQALEVAGQYIKVTGNNAGLILSDTTSGSDFYVFSNGDNLRMSVSGGSFPSAYFQMSTAGHVGLGANADSTDRLTVAGNIHATSTVAGASVLTIDGTNGTLFEVVDDLSGSLMSVNDAAGLPVLEVFADSHIVAGRYGQNDFYLDTNGNLGLGTATPITQLHISSASTSVLTIQNTTNVGNASLNFRDEGGTDQFKVFYDLPNNRAWNYVNGNGLTIYSTQSSAEIVRFGLGGGNTYIDSLFNGNVGIGVTPGAKLDVLGVTNGSLILTRTSSGIVSAIQDSAGYGELVLYQAGGGAKAHIHGNADSYLLGGGLGIGTATPQHDLHVEGDAIISGYLYDSTNSTGVAGYVLTSEAGGPQWQSIEDVLSGVGGGGTTNYIPKWDDPDTLGDSVIAQSGVNIGIGKADPTARLDVKENIIVRDTDSDLEHIQLFSNSTEGVMRLRNGANWGFIARGISNSPYIGAYSGGSLHVAGFTNANGSTYNSALMSFDFANQRVGINNGSPVAKLDIRGDLIVDVTNNTYGGVRIHDDSSADYNVYLDMGRDQGNTQFHIRRAGRTAGTNTWASGSDVAVFSTVKSWIPNGNVGIGTANPNQLLEVSNSSTTVGPVIRLSNLNDAISAGGTHGAIEFFSGDNSGPADQLVTSIKSIHVATSPNFGELAFHTGSNVEQVRINTNGNVGIGTATPTLAKLQIVNAANSAFLVNTGAGTGYTYLKSTNTGGEFILGINRSDGILFNSGLAYATSLGTTGSTALQFHTNNNPRVTIDAGGNVGIDRTSPQDVLHVNGGIIAEGTQNSNTNSSYPVTGLNTFKLFGKRKTDTSNNLGGIGIVYSSGYEDPIIYGYDNNTNNRIYFGSLAAGDRDLGTGFNPIAVVDTYNDRFGIGTTSPSYDLHVSSSSTTAAIGITGTGGSKDTWTITSSDSSGYGVLNFRDEDSSTTALTLRQDGKVGIGTTIPAALLDVYSSSAPTIRISNGGGTSPSPALELYRQAGVSATLFYEPSAKNLYLRNDFSTVGGDGNIYIQTRGSNTRLGVKSDGAIQFNTYGSGNNTGTVAQKLAVDSSGNVIETDEEKYLTSTGGTIDTGFTADEFRMLEVVGHVNPNSAGSASYRDPVHIYVYNGVGWNGSVVTNYVYSTQIAPIAREAFTSGSSSSGNIIEAVFLTGSTESDSCPNSSASSYQVRLKISNHAGNSYFQVKVIKRF